MSNFNVSDLSVEASVKLHKHKGSWSLSHEIDIAMEDFELMMDQNYLNRVLRFFKPLYTILVKKSVNFLAKFLINREVNTLNWEI